MEMINEDYAEEKLNGNEKKTDKVFNKALAFSFSSLSLCIILIGLIIIIVGALLFFAIPDRFQIVNHQDRSDIKLHNWKYKVLQSDFAANYNYRFTIFLLGFAPFLSGTIVIYACSLQNRTLLMVGLSLFMIFIVLVTVLIIIQYVIIFTIRRVHCDDLEEIFQEQRRLNETELLLLFMHLNCCGSKTLKEYPANSKIFQCCSFRLQCRQVHYSSEESYLLSTANKKISEISGCCYKLVWQLTHWSQMLLSMVLILDIMAISIGIITAALIFSYTEIDSELTYWKKLLRASLKVANQNSNK